MPMSGPGAFQNWEENPGSKEYCIHVPIRGVSAKPDCIQSVFSSGLSSLQVRDRFRNSPILSQKAKAKLVASLT